MLPCRGNKKRWHVCCTFKVKARGEGRGGRRWRGEICEQQHHPTPSPRCWLLLYASNERKSMTATTATVTTWLDFSSTRGVGSSWVFHKVRLPSLVSALLIGLVNFVFTSWFRPRYAGHNNAISASSFSQLIINAAKLIHHSLQHNGDNINVCPSLLLLNLTNYHSVKSNFIGRNRGLAQLRCSLLRMPTRACIFPAKKTSHATHVAQSRSGSLGRSASSSSS